MKNLPLALKLFTKTVFCIKIILSGGEVMKIRVEISEDANEEIIIRCREYTDKIGTIEAVLKNTVNEARELLFYIGNTEYYLPLGLWPTRTMTSPIFSFLRLQAVKCTRIRSLICTQYAKHLPSCYSCYRARSQEPQNPLSLT